MGVTSVTLKINNYKQMKKSKIIKTLRKLHKWPGLIIGFIAILFAASGIVMNHRSFFSSLDISRNLLPKNYTYQNWNMAAVRSSVPLGNENLVYGNIGIWKCDSNFQHFSDFNQGFPAGIDHRKIYAVQRLNNQLFAGTHLGLYQRNLPEENWEKIALHLKNERIADLSLKNDTLLVLTRDYLLKSADGSSFKISQLPEPLNYERKTGLFDTFWQLHSGELFGLTGKLIVDLLGIVTIALSITGILHFFFPRIIRKRKARAKPTQSIVSIKKQNLHWHNVVGYIFVLFLIINTFAGIHLRPPLLIAIANKQAGIIPGTNLDQKNPWFDKLRRVMWDESSQRYLFSTSEGFYYTDESLDKKLLPAGSQAPVSIMGCNVLKRLDDQHLLVGSFSGMFVWNQQNGMVSDFFSGQMYQAPTGMTRPIAANMAAGMVKSKHSAFWFDYNRGVIGLTGQIFPEMPEQIRNVSPMSLWNVAQEIHTGRIFENLTGPFYILFVPLAGICLLMVLNSGFFIWWMAFRKKKKKA